MHQRIARYIAFEILSETAQKALRRFPGAHEEEIVAACKNGIDVDKAPSTDAESVRNFVSKG